MADKQPNTYMEVEKAFHVTEFPLTRYCHHVFPNYTKLTTNTLKSNYGNIFPNYHELKTSTIPPAGCYLHSFPNH